MVPCAAIWSAGGWGMKQAVVSVFKSKISACVLPLLVLTGCAQVTVHALTPTGDSTNKPEGARYYLPKPYLLVMRLPPDSADTGATGGGGGGSSGSDGHLPKTRPKKPVSDIKPGHPAGPVPDGPPAPGGASGSKPSDDGSDGSPKSGTAAPASNPTSDLSYSATNGAYVAKLIYLPDLSQPMAISESPGLLGTASMGASLQDGWMLTSLQGSSDAKVADTLSAMASLVSAAAGGGASAAAKGAKKAAPPSAPGGGQAPPPTPPPTPLLSAGLYAFQYPSNGKLLGLCRMTAFEPPPAGDTVASCPKACDKNCSDAGAETPAPSK